jgi:hypothetical protein
VVALASVGCVYRAFIEGAVAFVGKGSLFVKGLSEAARAGVADDIKGVNRRDLRRRLMIYKLKGPLVSMNSLISVSDYSVRLSLWAILYSIYSTDLLFLLKTYTPLCRSSYLSLLITDLLVSLNIYTLKLLKSSWYDSYRLLSLKLYLVYSLILKLM